MRFVDTNVLLYAVSRDPAEHGKTQRAEGIIQSRDLGLSTQVLQEFYVQATRPTRIGALTHREAADLVRSLARFPVQPITLRLVESALQSRERFGIAYWDAVIIEAARALKCDQLLTEDLQAGQDYAGVVVVNPFL